MPAAAESGKLEEALCKELASLGYRCEKRYGVWIRVCRNHSARGHWRVDVYSLEDAKNFRLVKGNPKDWQRAKKLTKLIWDAIYAHPMSLQSSQSFFLDKDGTVKDHRVWEKT